MSDMIAVDIGASRGARKMEASWIWMASKALGIFADPHSTCYYPVVFITLLTISTLACKVWILKDNGSASWNARELFIPRGLWEITTAVVHLWSLRRRKHELAAIIDRASVVRRPRILFLVGAMILKHAWMGVSNFMKWRPQAVRPILINVVQLVDDTLLHLIVLQFCTLIVAFSSIISCLKPTRNSTLLACFKFSQVGVEISNIDAIFNIQNLLIGLRVMLNLMFHSYFSIYHYNEGKNTSFIADRALDAIWQIFLAFMICASVEDLNAAAKKFHQELFEVMRRNPDLCSNDKLKLYILMKPKITFTACGFFTLGYPLVTSIIAAALTYLVILVQFTQKQT